MIIARIRLVFCAKRFKLLTSIKLAIILSFDIKSRKSSERIKSIVVLFVIITNYSIESLTDPQIH